MSPEPSEALLFHFHGLRVKHPSACFTQCFWFFFYFSSLIFYFATSYLVATLSLVPSPAGASVALLSFQFQSMSLLAAERLPLRSEDEAEQLLSH